MGRRHRRGVRRRWTVTVLAAALVWAACGGTLTGPDGDGVVLDGVRYRISELLVAESFPVQIGVTVELLNESPSARTVVFPDGCVVLMRAYADGSSEPAWDMAAGTACTTALVEIRLEAGERREFRTGLVSAAAILDGGLAAGRYLMTAYLRPDGIVELEAGQVDLTAP